MTKLNTSLSKEWPTKIHYLSYCEIALSRSPFIPRFPHRPVAMHELPPTSLFYFTRNGAIFFALNCFEDASTAFYLSPVVGSVGPEVGSMVVGEYGGSLLATAPPMSPDRVIGSPSMVTLLLLMCLMSSGSAVRGSLDLAIH
jgi:hypothetical protein